MYVACATDFHYKTCSQLKTSIVDEILLLLFPTLRGIRECIFVNVVNKMNELIQYGRISEVKSTTSSDADSSLTPFGQSMFFYVP